MITEQQLSSAITRYLKENQVLLVQNNQSAALTNTDIKIRVSAMILLGQSDDTILAKLAASFKAETRREYLDGGRAIVTVLESLDAPFLKQIRNITPKKSRINEKKILALTSNKDDRGELPQDEKGNHVSELSDEEITQEMKNIESIKNSDRN
jgi:hypothetical protein